MATPPQLDRNLTRPVTEAEIREVRRSMALQTLTLPAEPLASRESAKNTMVIAGSAHDLNDAEQLLQDLLTVGFVRQRIQGELKLPIWAI